MTYICSFVFIYFILFYLFTYFIYLFIFIFLILKILQESSKYSNKKYLFVHKKNCKNFCDDLI